MFRWLLVCLLGLLADWHGLAVASEWQHVYSRDGIEVSKKDVPGSPLIAVRAHTILNHSQGRVLTLMVDIEKRKLWVDRLAYITRVKEFDGILDAVSYYRIGLPWPVEDRDFVVRTKIFYNPESGMLESNTWSVDGFVPVDKKFIRAKSHDSTVKLRKVSDTKTEIIVEARIDPMGSIPAWFINYMQTKWAYYTLTKLDEALRTHAIEVDPIYYRLMSPQPGLAPGGTPASVTK